MGKLSYESSNLFCHLNYLGSSNFVYLVTPGIMTIVLSLKFGRNGPKMRNGRREGILIKNIIS